MVLGAYIAVSAVFHCIWSFSTGPWQPRWRAISTHPDISVIMPSESRAAMSMLASGDIGVFGNRHIVVMKGVHCEALPTGFGFTHAFVWNALEAWAGLPAGQDAILRFIKSGEARSRNG